MRDLKFRAWDDHDTAFLMAKYMGRYNDPPFIVEKLSGSFGEGFRSYINVSSVPDKFFPKHSF